MKTIVKSALFGLTLAANSALASGNEIGKGGFGYQSEKGLMLFDFFERGVSPIPMDTSDARSSLAIIEFAKLGAKNFSLPKALDNAENRSFLNGSFVQLGELARVVDTKIARIGIRDFSFLKFISENLEIGVWRATDAPLANADDLDLANLKAKIKIDVSRLVLLGSRSENETLFVLEDLKKMTPYPMVQASALWLHEMLYASQETLWKANGKSLNREELIEISLKVRRLVAYLYSPDMTSDGDDKFIAQFWLPFTQISDPNSTNAVTKIAAKMSSVAKRAFEVDPKSTHAWMVPSSYLPYEFRIPNVEYVEDQGGYRLSKNVDSVNYFVATEDKMPPLDLCSKLFGQGWSIPGADLFHRYMLHQHYQRYSGGPIRRQPPYLFKKYHYLENTGPQQVAYKNWRSLFFDRRRWNSYALFPDFNSPDHKLVMIDALDPSTETATRDTEKNSPSWHLNISGLTLLCGRMDAGRGLKVIVQGNQKWKFAGEYAFDPDFKNDACRSLETKPGQNKWRLPNVDEIRRMAKVFAKTWVFEDAPIDWDEESEFYLTQSTSTGEFQAVRGDGRLVRNVQIMKALLPQRHAYLNVCISE